MGVKNRKGLDKAGEAVVSALADTATCLEYGGRGEFCNCRVTLVFLAT